MLVTVPELENWMGQVAATTATAKLTAASGLVIDIIADPAITDLWDNAGAPESVKTVIKQMVQRSLRNPLGRTGEQLGDHQWQAPASDIYATAAETRTVRRAAGLSGIGAVALEGYLPLHPES